MPKKKSIIDRILSGELEAETPISDPDEIATDEGEIQSDSEPYGDEEDDDIEEFDDPTNTDDDLPDEEYCLEYMEANGIEIVPEPPEPVGAKYSKFRNAQETANTQEQPKVNMKNPTPNKPKNSTTPTDADTTTAETTSRGRGRPSKLVGKEKEVVNMYTGQNADKVWSAGEIAAEFSVSISCVLNCLRAQGVEIRPKGRRKSS